MKKRYPLSFTLSRPWDEVLVGVLAVVLIVLCLRCGA